MKVALFRRGDPPTPTSIGHAWSLVRVIDLDIDRRGVPPVVLLPIAYPDEIRVLHFVRVDRRTWRSCMPEYRITELDEMYGASERLGELFG